MFFIYDACEILVRQLGAERVMQKNICTYHRPLHATKFQLGAKCRVAIESQYS